MTLEGLDQMLKSYSRGFASPPELPMHGAFGWGGQVPQLVGTMTSGFTKQVNCGAAAIYPSIAALGVTPDDVEDGLGVGEQGADTGLDMGAETVGDKADKLRRWHKKSVPTATAAKRLKWASGALELYGAVRAGVRGGNNFANCEQQP
jgi:hypothetical protein